MKIVILSDFHANAHALKEALKIIDKKGFDKLILLGDILTYGVNIHEVLDLVANRVSKNNTYLIRGNHDQLYDELLNSKYSDYYENLPDCIKESVNFTLEKLDRTQWNNLNFLNFYAHNKIFYSHANPFLKKNWTYLNNTKTLLKASKTLNEKGFFLGIFGHTHRILNSTFSNNRILKKNILLSSVLDKEKIHILNAGSIGQPRNKKKPQSSLLYLTINYKNTKDFFYSYEIKFFYYSITKHLRDIKNSEMSKYTKKKLLSFY